MTFVEGLRALEAQITFLCYFFMFTMLLSAKGADAAIVSAAGWTVGIGVMLTSIRLIGLLTRGGPR